MNFRSNKTSFSLLRLLARQECMQEVDAGPSTIRDIDVDIDPLTIPRNPQHIYSGMEYRHTIPNTLNSSSSQRQSKLTH